MKHIHLPNFVIALIRTPKLPPTYAQFSVPLSLNKLDLKNYLRNAYGVNVLGVRSSIRQQPVEVEQHGKTRRYVRKRPEKRMTIEMAEPFVWPEAPKDLSKFDNQLFKNVEAYRETIHKKAMDGTRNRIMDYKIRSKLAESVEEKRQQEAKVSTADGKDELTDVDFNASTGDGSNKS
ncbi:hypothetical protein ABW20_dc0103861 [Dactylellina cionopaga]|nr:hypothetical protein ABW20_dc0103861 [Dactylellina cionopaga]